MVERQDPTMPEEIKSTQENLDDIYRYLDFNCEYSSNIPQILKALNISLAFTSYQAGRLMLVRTDGERLDINYKSFSRPMGLCASPQGITLGVFSQVINFSRVDGLVAKLKEPLQPIEDDITAPRLNKNSQEPNDELLSLNADLVIDRGELSEEERVVREKDLKDFNDYRQSLYEPADDRVDSCFITRSSHFTGMINLHDIEWGDEGLWVVNSSFSCLCTLDPDYSFVPRWKPFFISELVPEDRCHLNGMTLKDGKPAYVTTFSSYDELGKWRQEKTHNGTLMDVEKNEIILDQLVMPHSPRWYQDKVYFCHSGEGTLESFDPSTGKHNVVAELHGFTRGMDFYGPIAFVGSSKLREGTLLQYEGLEKKLGETHSGIWLVNLNDGSIIGHILFTGNVDQIYDVAVIANSNFPELLEPTHPRMRNHFCIP
ncbi:hypothetical protein MAH3_15540 [Sessilibacter sp. MAH3]